MKWYIVILTSQEYYTLYEKSKIILAKDSAEASQKALEGEYGHVAVGTLFDCGTRKPKEA